jgi:ankyrin repeat protein
MSILEFHTGAGTLLNLAKQFFQHDSYAWRVWVAVGFEDYPSLKLNLERRVTQRPWIWIFTIPDIVHPITYISAAGLATLLVNLLRKCNVDINTIPQTPVLASPLYAAAINNRHRTVDVLLTAGADPNTYGGNYGTALQAASAFGNLSVIPCLLNAGAEINAQSGYFGNALQAAARSGVPDVVRLLVNAGANVNAQGGLFGNALQSACYEGTIESVELLLKNGADVNAQGGHFGNALQAAAARGYVNVVKLLLDNGAHVKDSEGNFAVSLGDIPGRNELELIQLLLKYGAIEEPPSASVSRRTSLESGDYRVSQSSTSVAEPEIERIEIT